MATRWDRTMLHHNLELHMRWAMHEAACEVIRQFNEGKINVGHQYALTAAPTEAWLPPKKMMIEIMDGVLAEIRGWPSRIYLPEDYPARGKGKLEDN